MTSDVGGHEAKSEFQVFVLYLQWVSFSASCTKFLSMSFENRKQLMLRKQLCINCLSEKHWNSNCLSNTAYDQCFNMHPMLRCHHLISQRLIRIHQLHHSWAVNQSRNILLETVLIHVRDQWENQESMRAIIVLGSQANAVTTSCVERIGLWML